MDRKRECLQSYFAGIFDGEGSVGIYSGGYIKTHNLRASIQMDDPKALFLLWREYPEGVLRKGDRDGGRPYWVARWNDYKAERFLQEILPYTILKREQIKLALSYIAHRRRDHRGTRGFDCKQRCERFASKIKNAKAVDPRGVNSVNALLDYELREYRAKRSDVEADVLILTRKVLDCEGVETSAEGSTPDKANSAPEKDIVQGPPEPCLSPGSALPAQQRNPSPRTGREGLGTHRR